MSQHCVSPLVHVIKQPISVISQRHMPMVKLQVQQGMPLYITQQLAMPPWSIVHRFWTMLQASLSSQEQVILKPPVHFSSLMVHRGTIIQLVPAVTPVGVGLVPYPGMPMPGNAVPVRSIIIALDINELLSCRRLCRFPWMCAGSPSTGLSPEWRKLYGSPPNKSKH